MTLEELRSEIATGAIDTVVIAMTDMQGRLVGKRVHGTFFLEEVLKHGTEGCNYPASYSLAARCCHVIS
jgi:glutamine synthetase